jgi:ABC-type transport system substrate-binding protein
MPLCFLVVQVIICTVHFGSKAWARSVIKIGILEEPKTLNIWLASDSWSRKVLGQIYHPLYIREPKNLKLVPWLAEEEPVYEPATLSYTIKLRRAKWSDGSEFTSKDVAFTGNLIKEFKIPRTYSQWKFIKKIETPGKHTVRFFLDEPKAIFLARTLTTPIVQKKEWEKVANEASSAEKPLIQLLNHQIQKPIGTGPFVLKEWRKGAYLFLEKNGYFFGLGKKIEGYYLGPHIDGIILKAYGTSDAGILALKKGSIDMFWWSIQPGYLLDLSRDKNVKVFSNEKSALYYLGFNLRKEPLKDIHFRHAVATLIDKDFITKRILQGFAVKMHTIVPPGNTFWHYPDVPKYGEGLSRKDRIWRAYQILSKAGYSWVVPPVNSEGKVVKGKGIILPDGSPMERLVILTPPADYDPQRAMTGIMIQEWLRMAGIPAISRPMAFGSLIHQVKGRHQFDLFILGYGRLALDPDFLRNFFHSSNDMVRGWNMCGYQNPDFDRIANESARVMELERRRELIREMQRIIMNDLPYIPLYNPKLVEAVRTDKFEGWINMLGGIGNTWSFCQIRPK